MVIWDVFGELENFASRPRYFSASLSHEKLFAASASNCRERDIQLNMREGFLIIICEREQNYSLKGTLTFD